MQIKDRLASVHSGVRPDENTADYSTSSADANFFNAALSPSTASVRTPADVTASTLLSIASSQLNESTQRITRSLKAISKKGNEEALGKLPNQLSNSLFLSQILVKSLGKTTQCIDKISNLQ